MNCLVQLNVWQVGGFDAVGVDGSEKVLRADALDVPVELAAVLGVLHELAHEVSVPQHHPPLLQQPGIAKLATPEICVLNENYM